MEILTLVSANLKRKNGALISTAILMFLLMLATTVILSVTRNVDRKLTDSLEESQVGDIMTVLPARYLEHSFFEKLTQNPNVEDFHDIPIIATKTAEINGKQPENFFCMYRYPDSKIQYRFLDATGNHYLEAPGKIATGEVYLPYSMKFSFDCSIGDSLFIETQSGTREFKIQGFFEEPMSGAYVITLKQLLISDEDFEWLSDHFDQINSTGEKYLYDFHLLYVYQKQLSDLNYQEFMQSLNESCNIMNYSVGVLSQDDTITYTMMLIQIFGNMLLAFLALLFVVVLIIIGNSISNKIEMEYVNLGVLKALGYSKHKLRLVILLEYIMIEATGAFFGILVSALIIGPMEYIFQYIIGLHVPSTISYLSCFRILLGVLLISACFIYYKTSKIAHIKPMRAISGGNEEVYFTPIGVHTIQRKCLGLRITLRQLMSNKKRHAAISMIVAILMYFLTSVTILTKGVSVTTIYEVFGGITSDITLELNDSFTYDESSAILEKINQITPVDSSLFVIKRYFTVDGINLFTTVYDDASQFKSIQKGRAPINNNEIIITDTVATMLNKDVGDIVRIGYLNQEEDYMISGIYQSTEVVGRCIGMSLEGIKRISNLEPQDAYITVTDDTKIPRIIDECNREFSSFLNATTSSNSNQLFDLIQLSLKVVTIWIYSITIAFAFISVVMICKKTFIRERTDIGIYKSLGFTSHQLRILFSLRFLLLSVLGVLIGIILIALFNTDMMNYMFRYIGITTFKANITISLLLIPSTTLCFSFFIFSYLISRSIKKVAIRDLVTE